MYLIYYIRITVSIAGVMNKKIRKYEKLLRLLNIQILFPGFIDLNIRSCYKIIINFSEAVS